MWARFYALGESFGVNVFRSPESFTPGYYPSVPCERDVVLLMCGMSSAVVRVHEARAGIKRTETNAEQRLSMYLDAPDLHQFYVSASGLSLPPNPEFAESLINGKDFLKALRKGVMCEDTWEISWSYVPASVRGGHSHSAFFPVSVVVTDALTHAIVGFVSGEPGARLGSLTVQALRKGIKSTATLPKNLLIDESIPFEVPRQFLEEVGVNVVVTDDLPASEDVYASLARSMGPGR